ncbi:hypothetical protein Tco_1310526 [Tanacetum coccineum]
MRKVLQERGFRSRPSSTEMNPRDQVKSVSTAKADFSKIRRIGHDPYAVLGIQHISLFSETFPFPRQLQNFDCDDWRKAQDVKILDTYDHSLPQKEKDPWSFTLPYFIHNICFDKALVDLGASVSVMPFSTYTNLGLGILSHTRLTIELADRRIKQPRGIAKNVLVRIGKFIFPLDFIILIIPEDNDVPLNLERPFLSTAYSKIDVFKKKITLRDNAFDDMDEGDVTDHIAKVLEITEWIKILNVEINKLRLYAFSKSLKEDAQTWRNNEINETTITNIDNPDELCRTEEFIVIRHSIGNDEEFITIGPRKVSTIERTPGSMSCIYHELFNSKDHGWTVTRTI